MISAPSLNGKAQNSAWQQQSVRNFFNQVNWENLPQTDFGSAQSPATPSAASFDAQAPLPLTLSVGQFFAAVNWDAVEMMPPVLEPSLTASETPDGKDVFTLTDFSDMF